MMPEGLTAAPVIEPSSAIAMANHRLIANVKLKAYYGRTGLKYSSRTPETGCRFVHVHYSNMADSVRRPGFLTRTHLKRQAA
jgi:hypothetical protein